MHLSTPDALDGFALEVDTRAYLAGPGLQHFCPCLGKDGDDLARFLAQPAHPPGIVHVGRGLLRQAQDVDRLHPVKMNATAQALEAHQNRRRRLARLLATLDLLPLVAAHRQLLVLTAAGALVELLVPLAQLHRLVLLVVVVLDGPTARPILGIRPQGLMHRLCLMEAPLVQHSHRFPHGDAHGAANHKQRRAAFAVPQRIVQPIQHGDGLLFGHRPLPHASLPIQ
mmetsp:Transcript_31993/g.76278  ORF Transcript_31993/g.76278 Transcript_31993/m.76278 type:complete len:226 (+) Transcript_31993:329-1006(+)